MRLGTPISRLIIKLIIELRIDCGRDAAYVILGIVYIARSLALARRVHRTRVRLCITFRVRVAVDGRQELSLKRAREEHARLRISTCCLQHHAHACVCVAHGRDAFDPYRPLTMLFESAATKASVLDNTSSPVYNENPFPPRCRKMLNV